MEMTTHLPLPKTTAGNSGQSKSQKARNDDNATADVASFPTLLQDNGRVLETRSHKGVQEKLAEGKKPTAVSLKNSTDSTAGGQFSGGISPLLSGGAEEDLGKTLVAAVVQDAEMAAQVATLQTGAETPGANVELLESAGTTEAGLTDEAMASAALAPENAVDGVSISEQGTLENIGMKTETSEKVAESVPLNSEKMKLPEETKTVDTSTTLKNVPVDEKTKMTAPDSETKPLDTSTTLKGALVDEKPKMSAVDSEIKTVETPSDLAAVEVLKAEVVNEEPAAEKVNAPAVENPALVRQSSAELDILSAQANAQKNYQQPVVTADQGAIPKPTLADLDLDSGSFESAEQKDQNITRILSSLNESTSPAKRNIRGQVLSRVVEHLQEEIGKEKLTIRLNPEKLGQVEVFFSAQGDKLDITMSSSGKDAEQAIQEGTRELAEKIADNSARYNLVDIKVESKGQDQQSKQESRQEERREKQNQNEDQQQQEGQRSKADHNQETGAGEWAAFHLGG